MKIIFLDIDGVICTRRPGMLEHDLKLNLLRLVQTTGAKIVLSTDWRRTREARQALRDEFKPLGMSYIGWTPIIGTFPMNNRPVEILQWIKTHHESGKERVEEFVCIDDRDLPTERGGRGVVGHFCKTFMARGLTPQKVDECIKILAENGPFEDRMLQAIPSSMQTPSARSSAGGLVPRPSALSATAPPARSPGAGVVGTTGLGRRDGSPRRVRPLASTAGVGGLGVGRRQQLTGNAQLAARIQKMSL